MRAWRDFLDQNSWRRQLCCHLPKKLSRYYRSIPFKLASANLFDHVPPISRSVPGNHPIRTAVPIDRPLNYQFVSALCLALIIIWET